MKNRTLESIWDYKKETFIIQLIKSILWYLMYKFFFGQS